METTSLKKNTKSAKNKFLREKIFVDIPQADVVFFRQIADRMGWQINFKQNLWDEFIKNSPKNVPISDKEIMDEVKMVRYAKI
ncbi:MAG: hypothetical protein LBE36_12400 [Flavobacteriaceae bacterium]|jgi:hypothetical protein|nr:hypothetical protein [Flavobacteriaceae bacterium]